MGAEADDARGGKRKKSSLEQNVGTEKISLSGREGEEEDLEDMAKQEDAV